MEQEWTTSKTSFSSVIVKPDDTETWTIIIITIVAIIVFLSIAVFYSVESFESRREDNTIVQVLCPVNQCATNIFNGEKRCPVEGGSIISNAGLEVCNSPELCDNLKTPYAIQSDGSTSREGVCQSGVTCRCVRYPSCPEYVLATFRTASGDAYTGTAGTRTTFTQSIDSFNPVTNELNTNTPIIYDDITNTFCTVPVEWLSRSTPGCNFIEAVTPETITECMGYESGCGGVTSKACTRGTLAFISSDSDSFNGSLIFQTPLACVAGSACPCGEVAVFDTQYGQIVCKSIVS